jgi:thioesterase domain-containing protein
VLRRDRVGVTDSFFDIGGSSLQVMRLIALIGGELGVDVGVSTIFLNAAPRQLAARIDAIRSGAAGPDPDGPAGPLVGLAAGAGRLPLFLIHPVGGTVFGYAQLARELAGTFAVHGLQSPALTGPGLVPALLGDLVTDYAARIRAAQPTGPYRLAGWSMGGVLAFEIGRLLEAEGAEVGLLALLDAPFAIPADPPVPGESLPGEDGAGPAGDELSGTGSAGARLAADFVADAARSLGWDLASAPDPAAATAADQLAWLAGRLDTGADSAGLAGLLRLRLEVFSGHHRMLAGYRPAGEVRAATLVVSAAGSLNAPARDLWPRLLTGPVAVQTADGDHYTFLQPPAVTGVAAAILKFRAEPAAGRLPDGGGRGPGGQRGKVIIQLGQRPRGRGLPWRGQQLEPQPVQ